ncbi:hypothetical protein Ciccas_011999 [Cichlidogyrus casuarinus]|uniref:Uncharacterized protein n=1 Tax=Cichlidogyrus casuarinus TaxID=1844966 RepID=A0ABD2PQ53_9PLAT
MATTRVSGFERDWPRSRCTHTIPRRSWLLSYKTLSHAAVSAIECREPGCRSATPGALLCYSGLLLRAGGSWSHPRWSSAARRHPRLPAALDRPRSGRRIPPNMRHRSAEESPTPPLYHRRPTCHTCHRLREQGRIPIRGHYSLHRYPEWIEWQRELTTTGGRESDAVGTATRDGGAEPTATLVQQQFRERCQRGCHVAVLD